LASVGRLIDAATGSGANTVQHLRFTLKDDQAVQLQALAAAASKAQAKAQAMASSKFFFWMSTANSRLV
jgi:uncharacterized protein YggE